jgi:hypothetical protein
MTALFIRDVLPAWTAQDLPAPFSREIVERVGRDHQFGIFTAAGGRIGTSWARFFVLPNMRSVQINHLIEGVGGFGPLLIDTDVSFAGSEQRLRNFTMNLRGAPQKVAVEGELVGSEIVCEVQVGLIRKTFHVNADVAGMVGESLGPFAVLPRLRVGQTWRLYMVDPLSLMLGGKVAPKPVLVKVTGREFITHLGQRVDAFVVEWPGSRSWVDPQGRVLRTELDIPLIGRIVIRSEPFDLEALNRAREQVPLEHNPHAPRGATPE